MHAFGYKMTKKKVHLSRKKKKSNSKESKTYTKAVRKFLQNTLIVIEFF